MEDAKQKAQADIRKELAASPNQSQRFSYVKYDAAAAEKQETFKQIFEMLEAYGERLENGRAKSLFLTHLEEAYMWVGKAIRDEQIARNAATPHEPSRG